MTRSLYASGILVVELTTFGKPGTCPHGTASLVTGMSLHAYIPGVGTELVKTW